jgi:hypothetical protein
VSHNQLGRALTGYGCRRPGPPLRCRWPWKAIPPWSPLQLSAPDTTPLVSAAAKLGSLLGAGVLDENHAREALESAADWPISGPDAYPRGQIERDISDGLTFGVLRPRQGIDPS